MERLLGTKAVSPGIRFYPTDEELFMYYLKRKVMGKSLKQVISEVDVYRFEPWDLRAMACLKTRDLNWFFFCPRAKKYPNGGRANRATECGYWKSTGNDRIFNYQSRPVGKIKTLVFHRGKPPGERTDWVMHEYRLEDNDLVEKGVPQDSYVICKIYEKSGLGPKNGETYGAHFIEEEWESDEDDNAQGGVVQSPDVSVSGLTSAVDNSNVAYNVGTSFDAAPVANEGSPNTSAAVVGTPSATDASVDTPYVTAASVGTPNFTAAWPTPSTTDACVNTPYVTAASLGMPNFTAAWPALVGAPIVNAASVESAGGFAASVGTQLNIAVAAAAATSAPAPATSAPAAAAAAAAPAPAPLSASEEEEMDRLLSYFTANQEVDICNIYNCLEDLDSPAQLDLDWGDLGIEMDDLK